jgi:glycerate kinase
MAGASGLALLDPEELDAEASSSAGTGELLLAARDAGAARAILAIGGTATSDGGAGALEVLERAGGPGSMELLLACDVRTAFERAAEVFGPQKGATPAAVRRLTAHLHELAGRLPRDPRGREMTGAGGGLAGALWSRYGAGLCGGAALVLDAVGFAERLAAADAVVVGEGCLDAQTLQGKAAGEILARAGDTPVHAVVGSVDGGAEHPAWGAFASVRVAGTPAELRAAGAELAAAVVAG